MTSLVGIPTEHVDQVWPLIEERIEKACLTSRGKETAFDVRRALRAADRQLWVVWEPDAQNILAVVITKLARHPRKMVCRILVCIGEERERWQHHIAVIEAWAKANGCGGMELIARPGWSRVLKQYGYDTTHLFVEKDF